MQDEVNDRKRVLQVGSQTLTWTRLAVLTAIIGVVITLYSLRPHSSSEPGLAVVVKPDIGVRGAEILAVPTEGTQPVDYLGPGYPLRTDCFKIVNNSKYALAHIVGLNDNGRWINISELASPTSKSVAEF